MKKEKKGKMKNFHDTKKGKEISSKTNKKKKKKKEVEEKVESPENT